MDGKYGEHWENTVRAFSLLVFAECSTWCFIALVGDVYIIFEIWRKFSAFPLTLEQSLFFLLKAPKISVSVTTSDHKCQNMLWFLSSFFFFPFFLFLVPASLSGVFAPSAWNSSGHREAAGLSFVSSNHSYWFGVWSNYGSFVLGWGKAGCMDRAPVWLPGRAVAPGVCALCPLHLWLFTPALLWSTDLLRTLSSVECRWMTLFAGASRARGKCWFS